MNIPYSAVLAVLLSSYCLPVDVSAQTQQQTNHVDTTHCWVSDGAVIENASVYRAQILHQRGIVRANTPGGHFDNFATRCLGTIASIDGGAPEGRGYCEWVGPEQDRVFIRWTLEAGRGSGAFINGTGRYKGISGEMSFRSVTRIPTLEPGIVRNCLHNAGEFKLP